MEHKNQIAAEQNKPERLVLLRAQRLFYARAKTSQNVFAMLALALPVITLLLGKQLPEIRPYLGLVSIALLLLDVGVFSRQQKEDCKRGAKVQEQFDTDVLCLNWNKLVAGSRVDVEEIREITSKPMPPKEKDRLENWYEPAVAQLPLGLGRLICQRTNITYDMRVRKSYSNILLTSAILLLIVMTSYGIYQKLPLDEFVMLYPIALPLGAFLLREHRKQRDTIDTLTTLRGEVEKIWEKALGASEPELEASSRALQDAIYRNRSSNPLVFDRLYDWLRTRNEDLTRHGANALVEEAQKKLAASGAK
jgi:hypothetical protein